MWSRKECGIDFLQAWTDGRLTFDVMDSYQTGKTTPYSSETEKLQLSKTTAAIYDKCQIQSKLFSVEFYGY